MKVKIGKHRVDVFDRRCPDRPCFRLGLDKGIFVQGQGYTSYHRDAKGNLAARPVCATRHQSGCPSNSTCPKCQSASIAEPGSVCGHWWNNVCCDGVTVERKEREVGP